MKLKSLLFLVVSGILLVYGVGCGTSSTNSQGVSFTLLGFFAELPESGSGEIPNGELGQAVPLSVEGPETQGGNLVGTVSTVLGLRNNISSQFVRVDRLLMSYNIEGASQQPPNTTLAYSFFLGPLVGSDVEGESESSDDSNSTSGGSSLPDFEDVLNIGFGSFPIVPPEIIAWLNFNRNNLPELPFTMTATVRASGVTSAGNRVTSNESSYFIIFTPDIAIAPTQGSIADDSSAESTL